MCSGAQLTDKTVSNQSLTSAARSFQDFATEQTPAMVDSLSHVVIKTALPLGGAESLRLLSFETPPQSFCDRAYQARFAGDAQADLFAV
jgi:hypothetical protein